MSMPAIKINVNKEDTRKIVERQVFIKFSLSFISGMYLIKDTSNPIKENIPIKFKGEIIAATRPTSSAG